MKQDSSSPFLTVLKTVALVSLKVQICKIRCVSLIANCVTFTTITRVCNLFHYGLQFDQNRAKTSKQGKLTKNIDSKEACQLDRIKMTENVLVT